MDVQDTSILHCRCFQEYVYDALTAKMYIKDQQMTKTIITNQEEGPLTYI